MRVVVIGGGLAGLVSALMLQDAGHDVQVLEARNRVGGRVHTLRDGLLNGQYADLGAEMIYPQQELIFGLCRRMGLRLTEPFDVENALPTLVIGGVRLSAEEAGARHAELVSAITATAPKPFESVAAWGRRAEISSASQELVRGIIQSSPAGPPRHADAQELDLRTTWGASIRKIIGGNDLLPSAIARQLEVHLNQIVQRVEWGRAGVKVQTADRSFEADRAVVAVPGPVTLEIGFDPPLPADKIEANLAMRYGGGTRIVAQYAEGDLLHPILRPGCFVSDWGGFLLDQSLHQPGPTAVITGLAVGDGEPQLESIDQILAKFDQIVGELAGRRVRRIFGFVKSWTRDRFAHGLVRLPMGDQRSVEIQTIAAPVGGRLFFAGEHSDVRKIPGGMEGAIRSAVRAVDEAIAA